MSECIGDMLCLFSANVAFHFCDDGQIVPSWMQGRKLIADEITILPSAEAGGEDIIVSIGGQILTFQGIDPRIEVEGSSANIAYVSHGLGRPAVVAAAIGEDHYGRTIKSAFDRDGISFKAFPRQGGTAVTVAVTNFEGQTTLFCVKPSYRIDIDVVIRELSGFNSSCLAATSVRTYEELELVKRLFESRPGATKAFIPHRELLLQEAGLISSFFAEVLRQADIIQVNEREANLLGKGPANETSNFSRQDLQSLVGKLAEFQPEVLIVTLGSKGAVSVAFRNHGYDILEHPAYNLRPIDTTGSGDSFLAAFLQAYLKGVGHQESVDFASQIAAKNAEGRGGHYVQVAPDSLDRFLQTAPCI